MFQHALNACRTLGLKSRKCHMERSASKAKNAADVYDRLDELYASGLRMLTLGVPPRQFLSRSCHLPLLYLCNGLLFLVISCYEIIGSFYLIDNFACRLEHWYYASYIISTGLQWVYLLSIYGSLHDHIEGLKIQDFQTAHIIPDYAKQTISKDMEKFVHSYKAYLVVQIGGISMYFIGSFMDIVQEYMTSGTLRKMSDISYFPGVSPGVRVVVLFLNALIAATSTPVVISIFIIIGIQTVKISCLSKTINEVLRQADQPSDLTSCIEDHIQLITIARDTRNLCKQLNNPIFVEIYFLVALQLFNLSSAEEKGKLFIIMILDASCCVAMLVSQCWFASTQTISMESIAEAAYNSPWQNKGKSYANTILMVMQMSQQNRAQKIWFGSLTVERATILQVLQRSYSFYTALMIMNKK